MRHGAGATDTRRRRRRRKTSMNTQSTWRSTATFQETQPDREHGHSQSPPPWLSGTAMDTQQNAPHEKDTDGRREGHQSARELQKTERAAQRRRRTRERMRERDRDRDERDRYEEQWAERSPDTTPRHHGEEPRRRRRQVADGGAGGHIPMVCGELCCIILRWCLPGEASDRLSHISWIPRSRRSSGP